MGPPRADLVLRTPSGASLCTRGVVARTPWRRLRGLLGRDALEAGEALLLTRTRSVHTCGMRVAIDVVFLDADDVVVGVVPGLRPWRHAGARGATATLELPAGGAGDLAPGDRLTRG